MLGYFRLFLALCVVFSHFDFKPYGFDIGKAAVFSFFVLAGYVSTKIYINIFNNNIILFARDRFLRIYPALLTLLIIPLNYCHLLDLKQIQIINDNGTNFILPPFWSLGVEIQAYILIALLLFLKAHTILRVIFFLTLFVFTLANLGFFGTNAESFNYIYLLGTFWAFGVGCLLFWHNNKFLATVSFVLLCNIIVILFGKKYGYGLEASIGSLVAIFFILMQDKYNFRLKNNILFGNISYHIFLVHYLFIFISYMLFNGINILFILIASFLFSLIFIYLDKYFNKFRNI